MMCMLEATGLSKGFGATTALLDATFRADVGEVIAVMGPSGSGKSTLLHLLSGILIPDRGTVTFDGLDLSLLADDDRTRLRAANFGFIFQFGHLVAELPAIENVMLPLLLAGVRRPDADRRASGWLRRLGIASVASRRPGAMSGGQAQRVALARALVIEPRVVFADEPTGALDTLSGERVMDELLIAAQELDTTVILVTHEPRVAAYADREVVVRDGRVVSVLSDAP